MKITEIREIAKKMKINAGSKRTKQDLIRDIQIAEGNAACFKNIENCGILNCLWREDCQTDKRC